MITKEQLIESGCFKNVAQSSESLYFETEKVVNSFNCETNILNVRAIDEENNFNYTKHITSRKDLIKTLYAFIGKTIKIPKAKKEEQEEKVYNWDSVKDGIKEGYFLAYSGVVKREQMLDVMPAFRGAPDALTIHFKEESQAESAKAQAMLSHIVAKIDEDYPDVNSQDPRTVGYSPCLMECKNYDVIPVSENICKILTASREGCRVLIRDNKDLLNKLYGINQ